MAPKSSMRRTGCFTRLPWRLLQIVSAVWLAAPPSASAHQSGASSLHLRVHGAQIDGEWELSARDARALIGAPLDREPDGLRAPELSQLAAVFLARAGIAADGAPCALRIEGLPALQSGEPPSVRSQVVAACPAPMERLRLSYGLMFDLDPQHRGYFSLRDADHTQAGVFHADQLEIELLVRHPEPGRTLLEYGREGMRHIWEGPDHILFLICLLLTATLGNGSKRAVGREVLLIVTAFTVAHSLTLALAVLDIVRLPARPVEVAIALSVFVAAWSNVRPWLRVRPVWLAFGFGLVHGLGFADALVRLGLPAELEGVALVGFNLGVEVGQLGIVALFLPLALALRDTRVYRRRIVPGVSFAIAWLALLWAIERGSGLRLFPWA